MEFGFALALAAQRVPRQCYLRLKEGLEMHLGSLGGERVRLLSWASHRHGKDLVRFVDDVLLVASPAKPIELINLWVFGFVVPVAGLKSSFQTFDVSLVSFLWKAKSSIINQDF